LIKKILDEEQKLSKKETPILNIQKYEPIFLKKFQLTMKPRILSPE